MSELTGLDPATHALLCRFFEDYRIRSIGISTGADISREAVSQVDIAFVADGDSDAVAYEVSFKLLGQASDTHRYLSGIGVQQSEFRVQLTRESQGMGREIIAGKVRDFIATITERVKKIHKEQSILSTRPVGKIYILNNKTRFRVLADDGEGQLSIEIMDGQGGSEARLGADDLLNGLYVGLITRE